MAGSIALTSQVFADKTVRPVRKYTLVWTSDASGNVNGNKTDGTGTITFTTSNGSAPGSLSGLLMRAVFIPGAGGVQPTSGYTATLLDGSGLDILAGQGASLSNTTTTNVVPSVPMKDGTTTSTAPCATDDILELQVSGGGNAKQGTVVLYYR